MKRGLLTLMAASLVTGLAAPAGAQTELTMSNWVPPTHHVIRYMMEPWAAQVETWR